MKLIDLHIHTTASDGSLTPREVVALARESGVAAVGITDHDETAGNAEALAAGAELGVEVLPGLELGADLESGRQVHILGYCPDLGSRALNQALERLRGDREARNRSVIARLRELGVSIGYEAVLREAGGRSVGRPHIAAALVRLGVVNSRDAAFRRFLRQGRPAYVERDKVGAVEAVSLILDAGGVPVLAHPRSVKLGREGLVREISNLKDHGLQGLEVYYPDHSPAETEWFADLARRLELIPTGGSDFHGTGTPDIRLGVGYGDLRVPYECYERLQARCLERSST